MAAEVGKPPSAPTSRTHQFPLLVAAGSETTLQGLVAVPALTATTRTAPPHPHRGVVVVVDQDPNADPPTAMAAGCPLPSAD